MATRDAEKATAWAVGLLVVSAISHCGGREHEARGADVRPSPPASTAAPGATVPPPPATEETAQTPPVPATEAAAGEWTDSALYRFRMTAIRRCPDSRVHAPSDAPATDGDVIRMALTVQVEAKASVLVSARDIALEHDGVVYASELPSGQDPRCGPPLRTKQLAANERTSGAILFTLPESEARAATLVFSPTRWGGAPRVAVAMPDCLDECRKPPRARTGKTRQQRSL